MEKRLLNQPKTGEIKHLNEAQHDNLKEEIDDWFSRPICDINKNFISQKNVIMKTTNLFFVAITGALLSACKKDDNDLLNGKWKLDQAFNNDVEYDLNDCQNNQPFNLNQMAKE